MSFISKTFIFNSLFSKNLIIKLSPFIKNFTIITIFLGKLTDREFDLRKECFSQKRDPAMEEYGWVLMGESEVSAELNLVGMCVDEFRMERIEEDFVMIELTRYH